MVGIISGSYPTADDQATMGLGVVYARSISQDKSCTKMMMSSYNNGTMPSFLQMTFLSFFAFLVCDLGVRIEIDDVVDPDVQATTTIPCMEIEQSQSRLLLI